MLCVVCCVLNTSAGAAEQGERVCEITLCVHVRSLAAFTTRCQLACARNPCAAMGVVVVVVVIASSSSSAFAALVK